MSSTAPAHLHVPTLRLGTRRSALAVTQSRWVAERIEKAAADAGTPVRVELVEIVTHGDTSSAPLESFGGVGVFVSRLREALLAGAVDLAVHSLKDLPTSPAPGLLVAAVPAREDPRDVLVARDGLTLAELPAGARVGTGSPRRAAQLRALGLGLDVVGIRGNVDTRLRMVAEGRIDAVVLARAGLARLGRAHEATEVLDPLLMLPAPGQGALAVECRDPAHPGATEAGRRADELVLAALRPLDDPATRAAVTAERRLLAALEAGCAAPLGALGEVVEGDTGPELSVRAVAAAVDGSVTLRRSLTGPVDDPEGLGNALAALLVDDGAGELVVTSTRQSTTETTTESTTESTAQSTAQSTPETVPRAAPPADPTEPRPASGAEPTARPADRTTGTREGDL